jgi:hypothetical protein
MYRRRDNYLCYYVIIDFLVSLLKSSKMTLYNRFSSYINSQIYHTSKIVVIEKHF